MAVDSSCVQNRSTKMLKLPTAAALVLLAALALARVDADCCIVPPEFQVDVSGSDVGSGSRCVEWLRGES